jgi:hypothetical protein
MRYWVQDDSLSPSQCATFVPDPINVLLVTTSGRFIGLRAIIASRLAALIIKPNLRVISNCLIKNNIILQVVGIVFSKAITVYEVCICGTTTDWAPKIIDLIFGINQISPWQSFF